MAGKTTDAIMELCSAPIKQMGYELLDIEFQKEQGEWVLTLFIDKEGGVNIDDCEQVSRAVESIIDEADPIAQSYFLSVSSPGLDRPFKGEKDYQRNIGKDIIIKLYVKRENKKEFTGTLLELTGESIRFCEKGGKEMEFQLKEIAQAKPYIEF